MDKSKTIIVVVDRYSSPFAVWNAYKKHIVSIAEHYNVSVFLDSNLDIDIKSEFSQVNIGFENYCGHWDLYQKIKRSGIKHVYLPHIKLVNILSLLRKSDISLSLWLQGVLPEESFMRNGSKLRLFILSKLEHRALKLVDGLVVVSRSMLTHLENKYGFKHENAELLPCLSDLRECKQVERRKNSFVYVGGASGWQKIDCILNAYNKIHDGLPGSTLDFISRDKEQIERLISIHSTENVKKSIRIFSISSRTDMQTKLSEYNYGFLFRENSAVNRVSSPIKYLEYLSCGVTPILSEKIGDYSEFTQVNNLGIVVPHNEEERTIGLIKQKVVTSEHISAEYQKLQLFWSNINIFKGLFDK